jgi:hypothetical protein
MKKAMFLSILVSIAIAALAAGIDDYLSDLKCTKEDVQHYIENSIGGGYLSYPGDARLIPAAKRAAIVRAAGEFAKTYVKTDAFKSWYAEYRDQHKPTMPEELKSAADNRSEQVDSLKKSLAEMEKAYKEAPAGAKEIFRQNIETTKQMLKEFGKANPQQDQQMDQYAKQANEQSRKEYNDKVAQWEKEFPAGNYRPLLKKRLKEFLDASAGVDFNATLVAKGKKKAFANPDYENKDGDWKRCFRAGKEATEAARAFAQQWLKEL